MRLYKQTELNILGAPPMNAIASQSILNNIAWTLVHQNTNIKKGSKKKFFGPCLKRAWEIMRKFRSLSISSAAAPVVAMSSDLGQQVYLTISAGKNNNMPMSPKEETETQETEEEYEIYSYEAENGALTERVEWDDGRKTKNWVASVTPGGPGCQFKLARDFISLCKNRDYYVMQSDLKVGECYEFASTAYSNSGNRKLDSRTYAIPLSHTENETLLAVFETAEEMFRYYEKQS